METTYQAQRGVYQKLILRSRFNRQPFPLVVPPRLRQAAVQHHYPVTEISGKFRHHLRRQGDFEVRAGNGGMISTPLRRELEENLARGEQSILFLNRRGSSRMFLLKLV